MGGQVQLIVDTATALRGHVQNAKLKAIAITTLKSGALLPGVKSVAEQGVAGFEMTPWTAMYAPRGTPPDIVAKLQATLKDVMETPQFKAKLVALDQQPGHLLGPDLLREQRREREVWRKVATARNIVLE